MSDKNKSVGENVLLAGTNQLEILLFSLGRGSEGEREEIFGINVFKVREVINVPEITRAPGSLDSVEGMISLRGVTMPVINLSKYCGMEVKDKPGIMIVCEYNNQVLGFLVHSVDSIKRLAWENVKVPPVGVTNNHGGLVTSITELDNNHLVMIMDVEKILSEAAGSSDDDSKYVGIKPYVKRDITILFADDSVVARKQIQKTLEYMGIRYISTANGQEAWDKLTNIAEQAKINRCDVSESIQLILTDVEMPGMAGHVLTKNIKQDSRFNNVPVIMHSSLSTSANKSLGESVGVDAYVGKSCPKELADTLSNILSL